MTFDTWTPDAERKDPRTQQDAYDLAADPTLARLRHRRSIARRYGWRGSTTCADRCTSSSTAISAARSVRPADHRERQWTDLVLGQKTTVANAVLDSREWIDAGD